MTHSPPFVEPSWKLKRQVLEWIGRTKDFVRQLEGSGLVVNHGNSDDVPAAVRERSSAIAGACIELTHGMLVIAAFVTGQQNELRERAEAVVSEPISDKPDDPIAFDRHSRDWCLGYQQACRDLLRRVGGDAERGS